ncbi:MAG TPA: hypothetical protein VK525_04635 [Candidatus Saccharimonadales bacterium]|nr:hypothetical protein [Candidatus Saccharimonadales bacterium]
MKKMWMVMAILSAGSLMSVGRVAAQGPAGAGATAAADSSSHTAHSYNPIKWVKKGKASDATEVNTDKNKKLTLSLQQQGVLTAETNVTEKCSTFKELGSCVAALHASHTLGLDFDCLKANVTGVLSSADTTSCQRAGGDKGASLEKSIHMVKPDADAKGAAKEAEKRAKEDLKQASA